MDYTAIIIAGSLMAVLAVIFAVILGIADKKFAVKEDERIPAVAEKLGGANCGACGYAGCSALAQAIVEGKALPNTCPSCSAEAVECICKIVGVTAEAKEPCVARLACTGDCETAKIRYEYDGVANCRIVNSLAGGRKLCSYGCLGFGDCIPMCKFGAISMGTNGLPVFDENKCVGCGECAKFCPRTVIKIVPKKARAFVACRNKDSGRDAMQACSHACIACRKCERTCQHGAILIFKNHSHVDQSKCVGCGECIEACPTKCIVSLVKKS